jgi:hypothetical protein
LLARHILGLEEKIWKQFAPTSCAFNAARSSDPDFEVCKPMRKPLW